MMTTIREVAKEAGVSVATVSRVMRETDKVSKEKRERVLEAIDRLNYQPNMIARFLRTSKTRTVLVVVPDITNPFFSNVLTGIQNYANQTGYHVLLFNAVNIRNQNHELMEMLGQKQVDGIIMLTSQVEKSLLEKMNEAYNLVLACEYIDGIDVPTVAIDNISSSRKMTNHLIQIGYRKIAHISGELDIVLSVDRLKGYKQALYEASMDVPNAYIQEGDFSYEAGYNLTLKLLSLEEPPDAIFAASDEMAMGAVQAAQSKGIQIPEDIAIVGFDDIKMASIFSPALTTIAQPTLNIGSKAMELAIKRMEGEVINKSQYILNDHLIVRKSCGYHV
ncbi:predicted transcriptional regulator of the myo-inositol catabolic operon [Geomicrobium sp. JCM 19039]|nr:predicted transcriptional regulator of the myo-inositol catabolic operon [Geomicrobium sp. JCM 19039]